MTAADIVLAGPRHGITISGAQQISSLLFQLIPVWPRLPATAARHGSTISVHENRGHWRISTAQFELEEYDLDDGYMAANALVGALIAAYVAQGDGLVLIHAGATVLGGGLVLFLGDNLSGKSTFATVLAARGRRFFADDRLVLDLAANLPASPPIGRSLAIAPKLRLPLPSEADAAYGEFVDGNSVLTWPRMAVLHLGQDKAAGFGETLPVKAIVQLRRRHHDGQPVLAPVPQPAMVRMLLEQLFAPHLSQRDELSACAKLAGSAALWQLDYASAFAAADMVISHFGGAAKP
jgi:hypothetical protein